MIGELSKDPRIIALTFHVDYWDRLGWRDPFSSHQWTERQNAYANALNVASPYTPQAVVDGELQFVGSDRRAMYDAIARASHESTGASVAITGGTANGSAPHDADLIALVTEKGTTTAVKAGENEGRTLRSDAIVRKLTRVARVSGAFSQSIGDANVVLLQDPKSLRILAAASRP